MYKIYLYKIYISKLIFAPEIAKYHFAGKLKWGAVYFGDFGDCDFHLVIAVVSY